METEVVWHCLKVFWLSKDSSAGHSKRKRRKGRQKKRWGDNIKEWTLLAQPGQLESGLGGKGLM